MSLFFESIESQITRHFAYFFIQDVEYIMDFSNDSDVMNPILELDEQLALILRGRNTYSVKFAVREYYESVDPKVDMFSAPKHQFKKADIQHLKETLENLLYRHYLNFQPECYFFIGNTPSRVRMYQKMCDNRHPILSEFIPMQLGENADCFIVKTPSYKEQ